MDRQSSSQRTFIEYFVAFLRKCIFMVLSRGPIPDHIAFIMDGNRRFSKKNQLIEGSGHRVGFSALMSMLKYCYEFGVKYVTIYAFSIDNFKRSPEEVQSVMELMQEKIEGLTKEESIVNQYGVRVRFVGNLKLLSKPVRLAAERAMVATADNSKAVLSICVAYTSTDEIVHAVQECCEEKRDEISTLEASGSGYGLLGLNDSGKEQTKCFIDPRAIEKHMYVTPDPDIIIRTSGETRLSNFLLWQSSFCLLYSPLVLWPEIRFWHLVWAILDFQRNYLYLKAVELGPLRVDKNGDGLDFNTHSWNKEANLLFVESPVGVGFSYTNTSSDLEKLDDKFVAEDTYNFLVNWLQRYPQWRTHDFFISGESYAGHYVPQLAELIYDRNKDTSKYPYINLKGFIVGNPETDDSYDYKGILEYAWSHSVIPDQVYDTAKNVCDFKHNNWSKECNAAMGIVFDKYREIDIYNIYAPICLINTTSSLAGSHNSHVSSFKVQAHEYKSMIRIPGGYDPCYTPHVQKYFNRTDVKKALHANTSIDYMVCSDPVFNLYGYTVSSVLPIYTKLVKSGLKIWIYSGDADGRVPVIGSRYCIEALGLPLKSPWRSWFHNRQVGGRIVEYEGLTMVTVRGAGHLVPLNKPSEALSLIHSFLSGQPLPTVR